MNRRIAILTSGHPPYDERIYWKFAKTLSSRGCAVAVFCSKERIEQDEAGILVKGFDDRGFTRREKLKKFYDLLVSFTPSVIICCEPLPVLAAVRYRRISKNRCNVFYDVTEWYPENTVAGYKGFKKVFFYASLYLFNIMVSNLVNGIIIGEIFKKRRYDVFSPFNRKIIIRYYPVLEHFKFSPPPFNGKILSLCYSGLISFDRGIKTLLNVALELSLRHPRIRIKLILSGKFQSAEEELQFEKLIKDIAEIDIVKFGWGYTRISSHLENADICVDLRKRNFVHRNSLPIKIFEYMACGKPFIFSDIMPIRRELNYREFGVLVDPENQMEVVDKIEHYIRDCELMRRHGENARREIEANKNWEKESVKLISFLSVDKEY